MHLRSLTLIRPGIVALPAGRASTHSARHHPRSKFVARESSVAEPLALAQPVNNSAKRTPARYRERFSIVRALLLLTNIAQILKTVNACLVPVAPAKIQSISAYDRQVVDFDF